MRAAGPTGAGGALRTHSGGAACPVCCLGSRDPSPRGWQKQKGALKLPQALGMSRWAPRMEASRNRALPSSIPPPPPSHFLCLLLRLCVRLRAINPRFLLDGDSKSPAALCLFALFSSSLSPSGRWHVFLVFFFGVTCGFVTPALLPDKVALPHPARPPGSPAAVTFSSLQTQR